jgi:arabinan endo-1,5-alpha-L-arabinosidase
MHRTRKCWTQWIGCLLLMLAVGPTWAYETNVVTRDPSTVIQQDGTYWVYGTGTGAQQFSSTDRIHWKFRGPVFSQAPGWVAATVPGNKNNVIWAPDIHKWGGLWHLYYSYSTWGSPTSGIGVAINPDLNNPRGWTDQGLVVHSPSPQGFNTIDPCIFQDAQGNPWLSFGSYNSGIYVTRIDPKTGKQLASDPKIYPVATRPGVPGNAIEASCVYFHDGYYYLFVNWDGCCAGSRSTYNIRVGRSLSVTGPYLDKSGKDMHEDGGTLFLGSLFDNGSGRPCDDLVGPGHAGFLVDKSGTWFSYHEEWTRDQGGATTLNINRLAWDADGWPRLVLDPGPYKVVSFQPTHDVVEVAGKSPRSGALIDVGKYENVAGQKWTLRSLGSGDYAVLNASGSAALTVAGDSPTPGAKVEMDSFTHRPAQIWRLRQNDDGTYTLLSEISQGACALDISGNSILDGVRLEQWTDNGASCQKWSFRAP